VSLVLTLGIISTATLLGSSTIPLYLAFKTAQPVLRNLSVLLGLFTLTHGLFHLFAVLGYFVFAHFAFDSASIFLLIAFGLYYTRKVG